MDPVAATLAARYAAPGSDNTFTRVARDGAQSSGVSWAAVSAGAIVAAALSLSLLALGTGLGFSVISPWSGEGASAASIGIASIVWLILMQVIAATMGGYVAGRLRTRWTGVNNDEVFFRDTAHGFLVWAVGLVITAAFLASAASSVIGGTAQAGGAAVATGVNAQSEGDGSGPIGYFVDGLFRGDRARLDPNAAGSAAVGSNSATLRAAEIGADVRVEAGRILANGWQEMPKVDKIYLAGLIADNTGISLSEAESRINDVQARMQEMETQARQAADTARKAVVHLSLWMFLGLLIGAFCASYAATVGGRQRDQVSV